MRRVTAAMPTYERPRHSCTSSLGSANTTRWSFTILGEVPSRNSSTATYMPPECAGTEIMTPQQPRAGGRHVIWMCSGAHSGFSKIASAIATCVSSIAPSPVEQSAARIVM
jgi:hypothetical protein